MLAEVGLCHRHHRRRRGDCPPHHYCGRSQGHGGVGCYRQPNQQE